MKVPSLLGDVQVPFAWTVDNEATTEASIRLHSYPADSVVAERLWDALYRARTGRSRRLVADLEGAAFRRYPPLDRTLAHTAAGDAQDADRTPVEQAAELGLANAILAWRQRTGAAFHRFARAGIRELYRR